MFFFLVVGFIPGAWVWLLGLLFLLVKETDTLAVGISQHGEDGCTVVVAGEASEIFERLQAAPWLERVARTLSPSLEPGALSAPS